MPEFLFFPTNSFKLIFLIFLFNLTLKFQNFLFSIFQQANRFIPDQLPNIISIFLYNESYSISVKFLPPLCVY